MAEPEQLPDAVSAADGQRFAELVDATHREIWRFCAHVLGRSEADDATQEIYIEAWKALGGFRGDSSVRTWLFVIARRTVARLERRRRRWTELADRLTGPVLGQDPASATTVDDLLAGLEPDRRHALVLTQVLGFSYAEAAAVCGCAVGTIRSRVARGREDLIRLWRSSDETAVRPVERATPAAAGRATSPIGSLLSGRLVGRDDVLRGPEAV